MKEKRDFFKKEKKKWGEKRGEIYIRDVINFRPIGSSIG